MFDRNGWLGKLACFVCWEATGEWESTGLASHIAPSIASYLTLWLQSVDSWIRCDINDTCSK